MKSYLWCHCERSEAISKEVRRLWKRDHHVASLLVMTQKEAIFAAMTFEQTAMTR